MGGEWVGTIKKSFESDTLFRERGVERTISLRTLLDGQQCLLSNIGNGSMFADAKNAGSRIRTGVEKGLLSHLARESSRGKERIDNTPGYGKIYV